VCASTRKRIVVAKPAKPRARAAKKQAREPKPPPKMRCIRIPKVKFTEGVKVRIRPGPRKMYVQQYRIGAHQARTAWIMLENGALMKEIGEAFGVHPNTVSTAFKEGRHLDGWTHRTTR
jgi:hypothetical protein